MSFPYIERPDYYPFWCTAGTVGVEIEVPPLGKIAAGWIVEEPPYEFMNFIQRFTGEWLEFYDYLLEDVVSGVISGLAVSLGSAAGLYTVAPGSYFAASGQRVNVNSISVDFNLTCPSPNVASLYYRWDAIVLNLDSTSLDPDFDYIENILTNPVFDRDTQSVLAYCCIDISAVYTLQKMYLVTSDEKYYLQLQLDLSELNQAGGGTYDLTGFQFYDETPVNLKIPSNVTLNCKGTYLKVGDLKSNQLGDMFSICGLNSVIGSIDNSNELTIAGADLYDSGVGSLVTFNSGANAGNTYKIDTLKSATACKLVNVDNSDCACITDLAVNLDVTIVNATLQNAEIYADRITAHQTTTSGVVLFGNTSNCNLENVNIYATTLATAKTGIMFLYDNDGITLDNVNVNSGVLGAFSTAAMQTNGVHYGINENWIIHRLKVNLDALRIESTGVGPLEFLNSNVDTVPDTTGSVVKKVFSSPDVGWIGEIETKEHNTDGTHDLPNEAITKPLLADTITWCLASFSVNITSSANASTSAISRELAEDIDGVSQAVIYKAGMAFPVSVTGEYNNWYSRKSATGIYQIKPPHYFEASVCYPHYSPDDVIFLITLLGTPAMLRVIYDGVNSCWTVQITDHNGNNQDNGFQITVLSCKI